jgi:hypothetical protein
MNLDDFRKTDIESKELIFDAGNQELLSDNNESICFDSPCKFTFEEETIRSLEALGEVLRHIHQRLASEGNVCCLPCYDKTGTVVDDESKGDTSI